jgi:hypothetical protein|tara:strand:+ start:1246 stop:1572 length:327 start_codon:yes stop_codon:yes gene_type:complete
MANLYTLPNTTSGVDAIFKEVITEVPVLSPMILVFVFLIVFLGGIMRQNLRGGDADYPMWSVVASLSTFIVALIMSMTTGIIRLDWLIIVLAVTIFSGVWLFLNRSTV